MPLRGQNFPCLYTPHGIVGREVSYLGEREGEGTNINISSECDNN